MPRTSLIALCITWFLGLPPAIAAEPCGDRLLAFNLYETMEEGEVKSHHSVFPVPEEWSDASSFHGLLSGSGEVTLEVVVEGKKKSFSFSPWEKDPSLFVAKDFRAKKAFRNAESGASLILRLKRNEKAICEDRLEASGD